MFPALLLSAWLLPANAAAPLAFQWPLGSGVDMVEEVSVTTRETGGLPEDVKKGLGTVRMRVAVEDEGFRVHLFVLHESVEKPMIQLLLNGDGTLKEADASVLLSQMEATLAAVAGADDATAKAMLTSMRADVALAGAEIGQGWMQAVGFWSGRNFVGEEEISEDWTRILSSNVGPISIPMRGKLRASGKVSCDEKSRARRCVRLVARAESDAEALKSAASEHPEILRLLVGPVPAGRGNASPDDVSAVVSEYTTVITDPKTLVPVRVETTVTATVKLARAGEPAFERVVVQTSERSFSRRD